MNKQRNNRSRAKLVLVVDGGTTNSERPESIRPAPVLPDAAHEHEVGYVSETPFFTFADKIAASKSAT